MTHISRKIFLGSLTSLAVMTNSIVCAEEIVTAPALEGGITASVGTFYVTPTSDFQDYSTTEDPQTIIINHVDPGYHWGIDASLGYIFEETANSIELFWRNITTSDSTITSGNFAHEHEGDYNADLGYELDAFDLMLSQFMNVGEAMQMRYSGGLAYVDLERSETGLFVPSDTSKSDYYYNVKSTFQGWGPRVGIDGRYGFDEDLEGLGIVGGGSMAYYLGDMDSSLYESQEQSELENNPGNHGVFNFRANLGIDYVYFFDNDEGTTLGLELGYLVDFYDDATLVTNQENAGNDPGGKIGSASETSSIAFAGPYLSLKAVF
ncbi:MAG: Lpg1974 family pore-forming outer membrane protein [Gammaproteobacteria bacterium]|jgi:hypothetical protein